LLHGSRNSAESADGIVHDWLRQVGARLQFSY